MLCACVCVCVRMYLCDSTCGAYIIDIANSFDRNESKKRTRKKKKNVKNDWKCVSSSLLGIRSFGLWIEQKYKFVMRNALNFFRTKCTFVLRGPPSFQPNKVHTYILFVCYAVIDSGKWCTILVICTSSLFSSPWQLFFMGHS